MEDEEAKLIKFKKYYENKGLSRFGSVELRTSEKKANAQYHHFDHLPDFIVRFPKRHA